MENTPAKQSYIVISYFPLMELRPNLVGKTIIDKDEVAKVIPEGGGGQVIACLWATDYAGERIAPVFILDRGDEIYEKLMIWCEEKPQEWFDLYYAEAHGSYGVCIFPRLDKSIERWKTAYILANGVVPASDAEYTILYEPICLHAPLTSAGYNGAKSKLAKVGTIGSVGILDRKYWDPKNPMDIDQTKVHGLELNVGDTKKIESYVNSWLEEVGEPIIKNSDLPHPNSADIKFN